MTCKRSKTPTFGGNFGGQDLIDIWNSLEITNERSGVTDAAFLNDDWKGIKQDTDGYPI